MAERFIVRRFGLLTRKQDDAKAVEKLDKNLRKFNVNDSVKYDFDLFGIEVREIIK